MGEKNLCIQTIVDELVGVVGILNDRKGSTQKDITGVLESLHGPMRQDVIKDGLEAGVLTGLLECKYRRYKVCKQKNISRTVSFTNLAGCSSWGAGMPRSTDSSLSVETDFGGKISNPSSESCSVKEILSAKSIQSSDELSTRSYMFDSKSRGSIQGSSSKEKKSIERKRLIVNMPFSNKKTTVEKNTNNSNTDFEGRQQEMSINVQTQQPYIGNIDEIKYLGENGTSHVKTSLNDIMNRVMRQFSEEQPKQFPQKQAKQFSEEHPKHSKKNPSHSKDCDKEVKGDESKESHDEMRKCMTEVMKRVNNSKLQDKINIPKTSSRDAEVSGSDVNMSLGKVLNKVMKRFTEGNVQSATPTILKNNDTNLPTDVICSMKTASRSVGTEPQNVLPSCSKSGIPKLAKRRKMVQENDSSMVNCHRYLTRSRAKVNDSRRSRVQSPSDSDTLLKRAKFF